MIKVGIIGTGNIGTDLLLKLLREPHLKPVIFAGRRMSSEGIQIATKHGVPVTDKGINYFLNNPKCCDVVYDCTSAIDATEHAKIFTEQGIKVYLASTQKLSILIIMLI